MSNEVDQEKLKKDLIYYVRSGMTGIWAHMDTTQEANEDYKRLSEETVDEIVRYLQPYTSRWLDIKSVPKDGTTVDMFGYIAYDQFEMRLTNCEFKDGEWFYYVCGEWKPITNIDFTPTHWQAIVEPT